MKRERAIDVNRLLSDVEWGMKNGFGPADLVPMLEKLVTVAPAGSSARHFATRHLAELLVERQPWRAAVLARDLLTHTDEDGLWATLGLALTVLGHHRSACRAFRRARSLAPECVAHAHNLGHLLDAALGRPRDALPHLSRAFAEAEDEPEIASSYAHALARTGRTADARRVLVRGRAAKDRAEAERLIARWTSGSG